MSSVVTRVEFRISHMRVNTSCAFILTIRFFRVVVLVSNVVLVRYDPRGRERGQSEVSFVALKDDSN